MHRLFFRKPLVQEGFVLNIELSETPITVSINSTHGLDCIQFDPRH